MKETRGMMVASSYIQLLEAIGRRSMTTHEIQDEVGARIDNTNVSQVVTRAVVAGWLDVVGYTGQEGGGTPLRVVRVTPLGRLLLRYAEEERRVAELRST